MSNEEAINQLKIELSMWKSECKSYHATKEALKVAIQALEQIEEEIDSPNRGTCDYFIVDRIEEIINKYKAESEGK